ncbi:MAG: transposase [Candidatus Humimicrobiaceae bacterium]
MFLLRLGSKRDIKYKLSTEDFLKNLCTITNIYDDKTAHHDTVEYFLERLEPEQLYKIRHKMVNRLIRSKCLNRFRLLDSYFMIAIDGTGHLVYKERHCPHCLSKKKDGEILYYYHNVLEAKLVTGSGLAISVETEFICNSDGTTKQDCELRAFYRMAKRLKKRFPQLKICLLLDSLYAAGPVMDILKEYGWKYIVTFKEGSMPERYKEFCQLKKLCPENEIEIANDKLSQKYGWVNDIDHKGNFFDVLELEELSIDKKTRFVWLTNFKIGKNNITKIARGGRLRWKIENEGFNVQKNRGFNLEHPYSQNEIAMKNFYLLLQIAYIISQLMEKGSLLKDKILKDFGSVTGLFKQLLEDLRTKLIGDNFSKKPIQIRLSSFP